MKISVITDSCYGDSLYVDKARTDRIIGYWKSGPYREGSFEKGWMPPHPAFFVRRSIYGKYGAFNPVFRIAAIPLKNISKIPQFFVRGARS